MSSFKKYFNMKLTEIDDHTKGTPHDIAGKDIIPKFKNDGYVNIIVLYNKSENKIYHLTGYKQEINEEMIKQFYQEIRTDKEFFIPEEVLNNLDIAICKVEDFEEKFTNFDF